jgi:hypothetical protein
MGETQHVAGSEKAVENTLAVDARPIGATEVANDDFTVGDGEAAVATGNPRRVKADLTSSVAADECQRLNETEVGALVQRDEAREHDQGRQSR